VPTLAPADQQMRDALLGSWRVRRYTDGGAYVTFTKDGTMVVTTRGKCANGTKAMAIQCKPIGFTVTDGELRLAEAATPPLSETERCGGVRVLPGTGTASNYSVRMGDLFGPSTLAPAAGWYAYRWAIHKSQPPMLMIEKTPIERIDERVDLMGEW